MRENTHNESAWEGMALVYSLIAKGMVVLAEYQTPGYENVKAFADEIHGRVVYSMHHEEGFSSFRRTHYVCTVMVSGGFIFVVIGAVGSRLEAAKRCLEMIRAEAHPVLTKARKATPNMLTMRLGPVMQTILNQYSTWGDGRSEGKLESIKADLELVKVAMRDNVEKVLDRGEKLDRLTITTETLAIQTQQFKSQAKKLRWQQWWNAKMSCFALLVVVAGLGGVIYLVVR